jgi:hypothetical protein
MFLRSKEEAPMRSLVLCVSLLILGVCLAEGQGRPVPPGVREGDKIANQPLPPPRPTGTRTVKPAGLKSEAVQIQALANSVADQVDQLNQGMMSKDLADNLKKLEKLAKHLRSEITP